MHENKDIFDPNNTNIFNKMTTMTQILGINFFFYILSHLYTLKTDYGPGIGAIYIYDILLKAICKLPSMAY